MTKPEYYREGIPERLSPVGKNSPDMKIWKISVRQSYPTHGPWLLSSAVASRYVGDVEAVSAYDAKKEAYIKFSKELQGVDPTSLQLEPT